MVGRYDLAFSPQEGDVEGLLHPVHVYGLAGIQQHPLTGLKGRGAQQALQTRPDGVRYHDVAPQGYTVTGDVSDDHRTHYIPPSSFIRWSMAGPRTTTKIAGKMKNTSGGTILMVVFAAASSAL